MLQVANIRIRSFDLSFLDVYWTTQNTYEDARGYEFYVQKSVNEAGPFADISAAIIDRYHFRDTTIQGQHAFFHKIYYRIRVVHRESGNEAFCPSNGLGVSLRAKPDLYALEMARQERLKLKEFKGREVFIFPRRTFGSKCPACFDPVQQRRTRSDCRTCYDTSFAGGYFAPIRAYVQILAPEEITSKTPQGELQSQPSAFRLANFPVLHEGDLIVEMENVRWTVNPRIRTYQKGRALIRQEGSLFRVPKDNAEYAVPVNLSTAEVGDLVGSPERNYTVPQNLEASSLTNAMNSLFGRQIE